jgi:TBC1 domain family protein 5
MNLRHSKTRFCKDILTVLINFDVFREEWTLLFGKNISLNEIQRHCFEGKLRDSRLRSVIWRVLLKVLPLDREEWIKIIKHSRNSYENVKTKLNTNPRCSSNDDPDLNNPLSIQNGVGLFLIDSINIAI